MIPEGIYRARGEHAELGSHNGKQYFAVVFKLEDGTQVKERWYMVSDQNTEISMQNMLTSGWDGRDMMDLRSFGSREVDLTIEHRTTPSGKQVVSIRYVNAPGQGARGAGEALSVAEQKAIAQKWNHVLVKLRAKANKDPVPF